MRIRCIIATLPPELSNLLPIAPAGGWRWPVEIEREYVVLALSKSALGLWYATFEHHEAEYPVDAPLALFEITERSVSAEWRLTIDRGDLVEAGPVEFDDKYFADDVQERRQGALARYRDMKVRLGVMPARPDPGRPDPG